MMKLQSIFRLLGIVFIFLAVISCKKDDESPENFITYNGKTYSVKEGIYGENLLKANLNPEDPGEITHDIRIFYLSDGEFADDQLTDLDSFVVGASFSLLFELYTPVSEEGDMDGEYRHEDWLSLIYNDDEINYTGEYLFGLSTLQIDSNENGLIDDFDDQVYINDGTISLSQQEHYFEIELNGTTVGDDFTENTGEIKMKYSGQLRYESE